MLTAEAAAWGAGSCPHTAACTTWHSYSTLSLQSSGQTMAPFRTAVPGAGRALAVVSPPGVGLGPRSSTGPCLALAARGKRAAGDAGHWLGAMPVQIPGKQPASSSSPAPSLLTTAL